MYLCHQLGKTEHEIYEMTASEFAQWMAYFKLYQELSKKQP